jgi:hypothetical protein
VSGQTVSLQGSTLPCSTDQERCAAAAQAVDYRGDVTLKLTSGEQATGYVFNVTDGPAPALEMFPTGSSEARTTPLANVTEIVFSGVDPAAGKSWQAWLDKVAAAEADGKIAELYPDEG